MSLPTNSPAVSVVGHAQADNCVREAKNAMVIKFLSMLLTQTPLNLTSLLFSKRGHTHNALGHLV